jgi:hypothetical protein
MALELRPNCEYCDIDLPANATNARICTYECTFCAECVNTRLANVCPNCGGGFAPRPIRPAHEWRPGLSLAHQPASLVRHHLAHDDVAAFSTRVRDIPPEER